MCRTAVGDPNGSTWPIAAIKPSVVGAVEDVLS
jgi:hypothetical protein